MRFLSTFIATAALVTVATTALAGGLSPEIIETPDVAEDTLAPAKPSANGTYIIVGVLAALLIAAVINADDDDDEEEVEEVENDE